MFKDQEELRRILPNDGPSTEEVSKYIEKYNNEIIIIKCGGSVLLHKTLFNQFIDCLLYTSPSPRDKTVSRMPSSA